MILAIDTTSPFGSLALLEPARENPPEESPDSGPETEMDKLLELKPIHAPDGYAHLIFGEIQDLLARHGLSLGDVSCFASAAGPGSFTGVRVGLTTVKGLAEALQTPVVPVSNLAALAWFGTAELRAPVMDARRGDIFGGLYRRLASGELELQGEEVVSKFAPWLASLPPDAEIVTNGYVVDAPGRRVTSAPKELAEAIARIAALELRAGRGLDPMAIDANYVRRSDAELMWRDPK